MFSVAHRYIMSGSREAGLQYLEEVWPYDDDSDDEDDAASPLKHWLVDLMALHVYKARRGEGC